MTPQELKEWRVSVDSQLLQLHGGHRRMSDSLDINTSLTSDTKKIVEELAEKLGDFPAFMVESRHSLRLAKRLGKWGRWLAMYVAFPISVVTGVTSSWFEKLIHIVKSL